MSKMKSFKPYRKLEESATFWYFDDKRKGFDGEPFLNELSELLNDMVSTFLKGNGNDIHLLISNEEFPGSQISLVLDEKSCYYIFIGDHLQSRRVSLNNFQEKYFGEAPDKVWMRVENRVQW